MLGKQLLESFPALKQALDEKCKSARSCFANCHLKASEVFSTSPEPAFLASRLASMAAQAPSRRAKAVTSEYAWASDSILKRLDAERERLTSGLPHAQSVVLPADENSCVLAADLLAIQKYIVTGFLRLERVQRVNRGKYRFVFALMTFLGQRVAYARFRGLVRQGARGTACGFASKFGGCGINCKYVDDSVAAPSADGSPESSFPTSTGSTYFDPVVIQLELRNTLNLTGGSSKQQSQQRGQQEAMIRTEDDAQRIFAQLSKKDKVTLFQKQLAILEDLCIEVQLDDPCLGAGDGNGRLESLRMLLCPASHWLPIVRRSPTGEKAPRIPRAPGIGDMGTHSASRNLAPNRVLHRKQFQEGHHSPTNALERGNQIPLLRPRRAELSSHQQSQRGQSMPLQGQQLPLKQPRGGPQMPSQHRQSADSHGRSFHLPTQHRQARPSGVSRSNKSQCPGVGKGQHSGSAVAEAPMRPMQQPQDSLPTTQQHPWQPASSRQCERSTPAQVTNRSREQELAAKGNALLAMLRAGRPSTS